MKKTSLKLLYAAMALVFAAMFSACEGPPGLDGLNGADGANGKDGVDANETCKLCHAPGVVDAISVQYELSKHGYGEAAFEEAGSASCGPCHLSEAFKYVCEKNIPATFTIKTGATTYSNDYSSIASKAYGEITCFTCHNKLHSTYGVADLALTTVAAVPMTMYGGTKTINLPADGGKGNLCAKCHQPRPITKSGGDKNVIDYAGLVTNPTTSFYDGTSTTTQNSSVVKVSYRTGVHYGSVGAIYAGVGGVEFGSGYTNSSHTANASCGDCHMATMNGKAGGHTFSAVGNFNGCNVSGCHSASPISSTTTTAYWKQTRDGVKTKLETIANDLKTQLGADIFHKDASSETNLWYGLTTANYDGYLDIYDASLNPTGYFQDPSGTHILKLTNEQFGAIINFQLVLRDYSMGIHNTKYTNTLLDNTIYALEH